MDLYLFCLLLGALGLVAMAVAGFATHGHDAGASHHAGPGHVPGPGHLGHGHGHAGASAHHGDHGSPAEHGGGVGSHLLALLAPRVAFSVLVGFGASGMLLDPWLPAGAVLPLAVLGGLAFEWLIVAPLWGLVFRFASQPAQTLESALLEPATAVTGFDAEGDGVIRLALDGQTRQILGRLRPEDRAAGVRVRAGDRLLVEAVDSRRDRCTVSWLGPGDPSR